MSETASLPTRDDLARFVHLGLCRLDALDPASAPLRETPITRRNRRAGALFTVDGPRRLRPSAVWAAAESRLIFYDSAGARVRAVTLSESPER